MASSIRSSAFNLPRKTSWHLDLGPALQATGHGIEDR